MDDSVSNHMNDTKINIAVLFVYKKIYTSKIVGLPYQTLLLCCVAVVTELGQTKQKQLTQSTPHFLTFMMDWKIDSCRM